MGKMRIGLLSFILLFIVSATFRQTGSIETMKRENRFTRFFNFQSIKAMVRTLIAACAILLLTCCGRESASIRYALRQAGDNRPELESVLSHYVDEPEKLAAARYLIANLPAHYSYADSDAIHEYYNYAARILSDTILTPEQQRDSMLAVTDSLYADLKNHTIPDAQIIKADYLIKNIDRSYAQWQTCPWASQLTFDEYLEWLLPYKAVELQELDAWRDTILAHFSDGLNHPIKNDVEYNTTVGVADMLRNEAQNKMHRNGLYTRSGLPLLSAYLLPRQTFGNIPDYALTAVLLMRSAGIPAVLDETPVGSRYTAATRWFVVLSDRGEQLKSEWDLSTGISRDFFPYERGPKVYRNTYLVNKERFEYQQNSKYKYPFDLGKQDITAVYFLTSDLSLPIDKSTKKQLTDRYVYIASAIRTGGDSEASSSDNRPEPSGWQIVDFGKMKHGKARFDNMGREVLYISLGYDGEKLIPITAPFILHKDRSIEYVSADTISSPFLDKWKNNAL